MNITLVTVGLLLIASAITLMAAGPRTWLVAMAHGLGMQAAVGIVASAVQVAWFRDGADMLPVEQRVVLAVEGIPFNTSGWTAASAFERLSLDQHEGAMAELDAFLAIGVVQMLAVAGLIAARKLRDDQVIDPVNVIIFGLLVANSAVNVTWAWWGA